jgi:hypothetical protein
MGDLSIFRFDNIYLSPALHPPPTYLILQSLYLFLFNFYKILLFVLFCFFAYF